MKVLKSVSAILIFGFNENPDWDEHFLCIQRRNRSFSSYLKLSKLFQFVIILDLFLVWPKIDSNQFEGVYSIIITVNWSDPKWITIARVDSGFFKFCITIHLLIVSFINYVQQTLNIDDTHTHTNTHTHTHTHTQFRKKVWEILEKKLIGA